MNGGTESFQHWDQCEDCGFQGLVAFRTRAEEDYKDPDALGFVMDSTCPACGSDRSVLMVAEQFHEMMLLSSLKRTC
jgi:hypothetical protein